MKEKLVVTVLGLLLLGSLAVGIVQVFQQTGREPSGSLGASGLVASDGIAIVYVYGPIRTGQRTETFPWGSQGSDAIVRQLRDLRSDEHVKAVVLRLNSPGGSVGATQEIYEEVLKLKREGKKVVASIGEIGASGAYYIASAADRIVCNRGALVGSVGVIMVLANMQGLFEEKLAWKWTVIKSGRWKDIGSSLRDVKPEERQQLQELVDSAYQQFLAAVKAGREPILGEEQTGKLLENCEGQVFTGQQAKERGLVDDLGTFEDAKSLAGELAGLGTDPPVIRGGRELDWRRILGDLAESRNRGMADYLSDAQRVRFEYRYQPQL